ncbi:atrial natriuretic peptide receptor 1-like protein [Lates japonicus]|uniref:Atrial natriuretic peptide receptor 1-like protein n=1 Tax=Lates japonicus TaxID=270547 RepID=A0AAD3QVY2_LATJO|nr:atrial natriuretic peptide receptor 1-like protein [Lates japonicus]
MSQSAAGGGLLISVIEYSLCTHSGQTRAHALAQSALPGLPSCPHLIHTHRSLRPHHHHQAKKVSACVRACRCLLRVDDRPELQHRILNWRRYRRLSLFPLSLLNSFTGTRELKRSDRFKGYITLKNNTHCVCYRFDVAIERLIIRVSLNTPSDAEFLLSPDNTTDDLQEVILAAILPLTNTDYAWAWPRVAPALHQAVGRVNSDPWLLPGLRLRLVHSSSENGDGFCSDSIAPLVAVDLKLSHDPWAFIGPGCDYSSSPVARFTTHWEVPMVTAGARAIGFEHYAAVTNTGPTHKKLGEFGTRIQETFSWRRHAMLIFSDNKDANDDRPCYFAVEGLYTLLGNRNITIRDHVIEPDNINYKSVVQEIRDNGRVVYLCCSWDILRTLMVQFWREGVDLDEYVFFFIDLFAEGLGGRGPVRPWFRGDQDDYSARLAFRSVKVLTYLEPQSPEYLQFVHMLKNDAKKMFNFTIKDSLYNLIAGGFHDGVMLYAHALNETLSEQRGPGPGTGPGPGPGPGGVQRPREDVVTRRMWNRTFPDPDLVSGPDPDLVTGPDSDSDLVSGPDPDLVTGPDSDRVSILGLWS